MCSAVVFSAKKYDGFASIWAFNFWFQLEAPTILPMCQSVLD